MGYPERRFSPHPMSRPGFLLVGLSYLGVGVVLALDSWFFVDTPFDGGLMGDVLAIVVVLVLAPLVWLPRGARGRGRAIVAVLVPLVALGLHVAAALTRGEAPHPGLVTGGVLVLAGLAFVWGSESARRRVVVQVDDDRVTVFVRRYRLEHVLPLDAVREVSASRGLGGRVWGYGSFVARVRKGTMKGNMTKPVVGEEAPEHVARENGWDDEERFHIVAGHPYSRLRRDLENRIMLARLPPKEREEAELAQRLAEDLAPLDG